MSEVKCPTCNGPCEETVTHTYSKYHAIEHKKWRSLHAEKMAAVRKGSLNLIAENGKLKRDLARTKAVIEAAKNVLRFFEPDRASAKLDAAVCEMDKQLADLDNA